MKNSPSPHPKYLIVMSGMTGQIKRTKTVSCRSILFGRKAFYSIAILFLLFQCKGLPPLPDPIWGFYDEEAAKTLRAIFEPVPSDQLERLRDEAVRNCDRKTAQTVSFMGYPAYVINGFASERRPGVVCNWNNEEELIFYGRFDEHGGTILESTWFLKTYLRSLKVRMSKKNVTIYRAWSWGHFQSGWMSRIVHVEITQNNRPETVRFLFNRLDGGLLERMEFSGVEPKIQYHGLYFSGALKRGEPNCIIYEKDGGKRIISGAMCTIPDHPDPDFSLIFEPL